MPPYGCLLQKDKKVTRLSAWGIAPQTARISPAAPTHRSFHECGSTSRRHKARQHYNKQVSNSALSVYGFSDMYSQVLNTNMKDNAFSKKKKWIQCLTDTALKCTLLSLLVTSTHYSSFPTRTTLACTIASQESIRDVFFSLSPTVTCRLCMLTNNCSLSHTF